MSALLIEPCFDAAVDLLESAFEPIDCFAVLINHYSATNERSARKSCRVVYRTDGVRTLAEPVVLELEIPPSSHAIIVEPEAEELLMVFTVVLFNPGDKCEMCPADV